MKLIFAQGNPGSQYDFTRHNAGFFMIDQFAREQGSEFKEKSKFNAHVAEFSIDGEKVLLAKPTTYYNETGRAARALVDFYKLTPSDDVIILHDELALPFGTVRSRSGGSDAGNNGIKSLNAALGQDYKRIRIGIWSDQRNLIGDIDFVVGKFTQAESETLPSIYNLVQAQLQAFIKGEHVDETVKLAQL